MKNKKKTKGRIWFYSVILILFLSALWFFIPVTETVTLDLDKVEVASAKFALITDLHGCYYGKDMKTLLKMIAIIQAISRIKIMTAIFIFREEKMTL